MRSWRNLPEIALIACLVGCASREPVTTTDAIDPLERHARNAIEAGANNLVPGALAAARARYEALDDLVGQWRIVRLQTLHALAEQDHDAAASHARRLGELRDRLPAGAGENINPDFETDIIVGRAFDDAPAFRRALGQAADPVERAIALTYLGKTADAVALLGDAGGSPRDLAFVHYRHGVKARDAAHLERALEMFRRAGDSRGIADALFALATIAADQGEQSKAVAYGQRAAATLEAIGDEQRAEVVTSWINGL